MQYQFKAALEADHPNLIPLMSEHNVKVWHFLVVNLPGPYAGGEYIFRLTAPDAFPQKPPEFVFLTNNGVFEPGGKICISIGEFHANDAPGASGSHGWRAALGMAGFAREVVNGMIDPGYLGGGIRVRNDSPAKKARMAGESVAWNQKKHADLVAQFREFEKAHPDHKAVRGLRLRRAAQEAIKTNFETADLESLAPLLAEAFGDSWPKLSPGLSYLTEIPDAPASQLASMGFPVGGRAVLCRVAGQLREVLAEYEPPIRDALCLALHARVCWEVYSGAPADQRHRFGEWHRRFTDAYKEFLEALPGVCGGASAVIVPDAMALLLEKASVLPAVHGDLSKFLRTQDIDEKARLGKAFAAKTASAAAAAANDDVAASASAEATAADDASAAATADLDDYLDEIIGGL